MVIPLKLRNLKVLIEHQSKLSFTKPSLKCILSESWKFNWSLLFKVKNVVLNSPLLLILRMRN